MKYVSIFKCALVLPGNCASGLTGMECDAENAFCILPKIFNNKYLNLSKYLKIKSIDSQLEKKMP